MNGIKDSQLYVGQTIELKNGASKSKFIARIVEIFEHGLPARNIQEPIKYKGSKLFLKIEIVSAGNLSPAQIRNINNDSYYHSWYVTKLHPFNPSKRLDKLKENIRC